MLFAVQFIAFSLLCCFIIFIVTGWRYFEQRVLPVIMAVITYISLIFSVYALWYVAGEIAKRVLHFT